MPFLAPQDEILIQYSRKCRLNWKAQGAHASNMPQNSNKPYMVSYCLRIETFDWLTGDRSVCIQNLITHSVTNCALHGIASRLRFEEIWTKKVTKKVQISKYLRSIDTYWSLEEFFGLISLAMPGIFSREMWHMVCGSKMALQTQTLYTFIIVGLFWIMMEEIFTWMFSIFILLSSPGDSVIQGFLCSSFGV